MSWHDREELTPRQAADLLDAKDAEIKELRERLNKRETTNLLATTCVCRKIGLQENEFIRSEANGRVHRREHYCDQENPDYWRWD